MSKHLSRLGTVALSITTVFLPQLALAEEEDSKRRLEEVVVTAERRESTVQDTAISITAFNEQLIEDFGLRNQEDLQNYIPATTIQPYDISIRGIGRVFRALGGDPGVSTYFDGAYSEDFGIASTEGGLYDIARIEILRGPQGTLYGRNGIGGAVNFHTNPPSHEFSGEVRTIVGSYGTAEIYSYITGSVIEDLLAFRVTAVNRQREGTIDDLSGSTSLDGYGDENYALSLLFTPTDNLEVTLRGNERSWRRVMASAQGAGTIVVSEEGGRGDEITGGKRNTSAMVFGYRPVDPGVACATRTDRTISNCAISGQQVFEFNYNGIQRFGQRLLPGVDPSSASFARPNFAYNHDQTLADAAYIGDGLSLPDLDQDDLVADTNGMNDEFFDHQAGVLTATWDLNDDVRLKYIGGYTDYLYTRVTEDDRTSNVTDIQFHANQENENYQHEIQLFWDISEDISLTAGIFAYENQIDQRLDFWSEGMARYSDSVDYGVGVTDPFIAWHTARAVYGADVTAGTDPVVPAFQSQVGWATARDTGCGIVDLAGLVPVAAFSDPHVTSVCFIEGPWTGDTTGFGPGNTPSGPMSEGTTFIWNTENRTSAKAAYAQAEWQINDLFALTLGGRWAEDKKDAFENLYLYREELLTPDMLFAYNQATGALDANGDPTGDAPVRFRGIPFSQSIYRAIENEFEESTWRVNVDYTPDDNNLIYLSATTGYRAGGMNLGYFSATPTYDPEKVLAVELGYKGQLMDGTLQLNASVYNYKYEDVHLQFFGQSFIGPGTSVRNMGEASNQGFEIEMLWLATDRLTIGGNYSYTDTEYKDELVDPETGQRGIVDNTNPYAPESIYSPVERSNLVEGNPLMRIPKSKFAAWLQYSYQLTEGTIDFLTSYSWADEVHFDVANSPLNKASDFGRWDLRVNWNSSDNKIMIAAFINNVTNEIGIRNMDAEDENGGFLRSVVPTLPRMGGIEFRYRFGAI